MPAATDVDRISRALVRALLYALGAALLVAIAYTVALPLVLGLSAIIVAVALNEPVTWLEDRRVPRVAGTVGIMTLGAIVAVAMAMLVGAQLVEETDALIEAAPAYIEDARDRLEAAIGRQDDATVDRSAEAATDAIRDTTTGALSRIGSASLGLVTGVIIAITWTTMVAYLTIEPRSLLRGLLRLSPVAERDATERVWIRFSGIVRSWLWANLFVGLIQAGLVFAFLTFIDIPGALVWSALVVFATFIPKIGAWIMAIPPVFVALAVDPGDVIWIIVFYVTMVEIMSDVVLPKIQSQAMRLHAFYIVLFVVAFGGLFGIVGAVIATPVAGLIAVAFDEWVVSRRPAVQDEGAAVERMLGRELPIANSIRASG